MELGLHVANFTWPGGAPALAVQRGWLLAKIVTTLDFLSNGRALAWASARYGTAAARCARFAEAHGWVPGEETITPLEVLGERVVPEASPF